MRRRTTALILSTLCLTACGRTSPPARVLPATPDPAKLASCSATYPKPPSLPAASAFTIPAGTRIVLPDGSTQLLAADTRAVLASIVLDRDTKLAGFVLQGRAAWYGCYSPIAYVRDWTAQMTRSGAH